MPFLRCLFLFTLCSYAQAGVSYNKFLQVKKAIHLTFEELRPHPSQKLYINRITQGLSESYWWDVSMVHASYVRSESNEFIEHNIYLMGGLARMEGISPEGLLLIGCHELGHGLGGEPRKKGSLSSTEGQADYFATQICLPIALKHLNNKTPFKTKSSYSSICLRQTDYEMSLCQRMVFALESEIAIFKSTGETADLTKSSQEVVDELNLSSNFYPKAQCRLDTMINGLLGLRRPQCWYPGGELL